MPPVVAPPKSSLSTVLPPVSESEREHSWQLHILTSTTVVPIETPTQTPEPTSTVTSQAVTTLSSTSYATVTLVVSPSSSPAPAPESSTPAPESSSPAPEPSSPAPEQSSPSPAPEQSSPSAAPEPSSPSHAPEQSSPSAAPQPTSAPAPPVVLPTPKPTSFSSTGTYTIPATTLTVTDSTTVCGATSTEVPSGTHTFGGVTTVVETSTTVTCPVATVKPTGSTVTSVIEMTTYVCPSAGTYTIAPTTTTVPSSTVLVYPTPTSFAPGTYTQPEQTVTATRTDITYICPPFTNAASEPTSSPSSPATPATPTTPAAPNTPATSATSSVADTATSSPASTPSSSPGIGGNRMGMTYSPYANGGGCKSKADVLKDIDMVKQKGFTTVRVYATDCNSLEYIGEGAKKNGLKMIVGVYIDGSGIKGAQSQVTAISNWAQWEMVDLIVVGNESLQSGVCSPEQLAEFIESSKKSFQAAGYNGKVTTTEPIYIWQQHGSTICSAVDLVGANIHPFFNDHTTAQQAGTFVKGEVDILKKICPGKSDVINLETGWPTKGNANGQAVPSVEDQRTALQAIEKAYGSKSVFFSYSNDEWKSPGPYGVEQHWGCIDAFN